MPAATRATVDPRTILNPGVLIDLRGRDLGLRWRLTKKFRVSFRLDYV